ncbi:MAG TPA: hypothetical protein VGC91_03525 [Pyrinomonadaceae bacterium]|jgi:hypothetical protein
MFETKTFPCPNCNEIINDSMETCRFCQAPVDRQAAAWAAETQSRVNQACSDASYLRIAAVGMWIFLGLHVVPFIPLVGLGFLIMFFVVLILIIRWLIKFISLQTRDKDYLQAKRSLIIAVVLWFAAIPVGFIFVPVLQALIFR